MVKGARLGLGGPRAASATVCVSHPQIFVHSLRPVQDTIGEDWLQFLREKFKGMD